MQRVYNSNVLWWYHNDVDSIFNMCKWKWIICLCVSERNILTLCLACLCKWMWIFGLSVQKWKKMSWNSLGSACVSESESECT